MELITETATQMMHAKASSLLLLDPKTRRLFFKVATGEKKKEIKAFEIELGQGIAGHVAQTGEPLFIPDASKDPRWYREISDSIGFKTRSIACVPMKTNGNVIGVMQVIDREDGSPLKKKDLRVLAIFADVAAMAIGNAQFIAKVNKENKDLREELDNRYQIIGESNAIKKVISDAFRVASAKTSVLILGESGTGKELLARLIHRNGPRKTNPLIILNCAALQETLLEAELFGYEQGAFTGATSRKIGKFELADKGTLFLDEIGEMSPGLQAKLLRVLQEGIFYRVGGTQPIAVDVRIISATNKNIIEEVQNNVFREDLYYRLNVVEIRMPPLRDRKKDIPLLTRYFLDIFKHERGLRELRVPTKVIDAMLQYEWPGNIRELRNALERAVVMGDRREISAADLPISGLKTNYPGMEIGLTLNEALNRFKKSFILLNLEHTSGNRSQAAKNMGIQRTYLSRLISKYSIREI